MKGIDVSMLVHTFNDIKREKAYLKYRLLSVGCDIFFSFKKVLENKGE